MEYYDDYDDYDDDYYNDDYDDDYHAYENEWDDGFYDMSDMPKPTVWEKIKTRFRHWYWDMKNRITGEIDDIPF